MTINRQNLQLLNHLKLKICFKRDKINDLHLFVLIEVVFYYYHDGSSHNGSGNITNCSTKCFDVFFASLNGKEV